MTLHEVIPPSRDPIPGDAALCLVMELIRAPTLPAMMAHGAPLAESRVGCAGFEDALSALMPVCTVTHHALTLRTRALSIGPTSSP